MRNKPKIIYVCDYSREDYVRLLEASKDYCELYFLFYASPKEEKSSFFKAYGKALYWKDFKNAQQLVKKISPDKIVFLYIESFNHVVLNLACRAASVPTYLLEHGLRADYVYGFDARFSPGQESSLKKKITHYCKLPHTLLDRIRSRQFLNNSIKLLPLNEKKFLHKFIKVRSHNNYLETFRAIKSDKRLADYYIAFSPKIYETYKNHEAAYFGTKVKFIGIPYFDKLAALPARPLERSILLIDQPLAEQGLLMWDKEYKEAFAAQLKQVVQKHNYKLYIKPHPKQDISVWEKLSKEQYCHLISDEMLAEIASGIPVVLGFYSTYLMPFAAFPHTTVLTYENHPAGDLLVSKPLTDAGVAHPVYDLEELNNILPNIDELHRKQLPNKAKFTEEWMYKFDGKAGKRLRDILLSDKV